MAIIEVAKRSQKNEFPPRRTLKPPQTKKPRNNKVEDIKCSTANDIAKRLGMNLEEVAYLYAKRILPEGIEVGGEVLFREQDIRKFEAVPEETREVPSRGIDPEGQQGRHPDLLDRWPPDSIRG